MTVRPGTAAYAVFNAINCGWVNAPDIADETGIPKAEVSVWLGRLARHGFVRVAKRACGSFNERGIGRRFHRYAPVDDKGLRVLPSGAIRVR